MRAEGLSCVTASAAPVQTSAGLCPPRVGSLDARRGPGFILVQCRIEYHYVNLEMSWADAQQHCREHYTDLATLKNDEDVNKLEFPNETWVWIGLFDDPASWKGAMTSDSNSWRWSSTGITNPGVQPSGLKEYFLVTTPMNWSDSQTYCRQYYHDLATIESSTENQAVTNLLSSTSVWIGLYRVAWRWSNGSPAPTGNGKLGSQTITDRNSVVHNIQSHSGMISLVTILANLSARKTPQFNPTMENTLVFLLLLLCSLSSAHDSSEEELRDIQTVLREMTAALAEHKVKIEHLEALNQEQSDKLKELGKHTCEVLQ
ncbi:hypothetical protein WMY93_026992 [Mugilogobius chulae]|uniref:C-type lectin domain-containing protein n=1 Tax=Mugilogobius chulae TaxID=88201 RepID=A0AAW0MRQ2_9GOBI